MEWLAQNWLLVVLLVVGGYLLATRMGLGGFGLGHAHGHSAHIQASRSTAGRKEVTSEELFDPVSGRMLPAATAIASVHDGRIYYFEDRANREAFEIDPAKYIANALATGRTLAANPAHARHRGHGCC